MRICLAFHYDNPTHAEAIHKIPCDVTYIRQKVELLMNSIHFPFSVKIKDSLELNAVIISIHFKMLLLD